MANRQEKLEQLAEAERRAKERQQFKAAQELESLRRTFKRINKSGDGKISVSDLQSELDFLGYSISAKDATQFVWEVDDDNDGGIDWDEFRSMFHRIRDDETGCEPRKMFNVVEFLMLDKNHSGSVDMDECLTLLWARYGKQKVEEKMADMKEANHPSLQADAANEKNVNFSFFAEIQRLCRKTQVLKPGATVVAKVVGLAAATDPKLAAATGY